MSWQFPSQPLAGRVLVAQVLALALALGLASGVSPLVGATPGYPVKVGLAFGALATLIVALMGRSHPHSAFGPGNVVTTMRSALVAVVAGLIGEPRTPTVAAAAAALALIATVLDGVDGWLARRTGLASPFGARFDMETDALLIMVLAVLAWLHGKAGLWIVLAGAMRYLFVAAGYLWHWMNAPLPPSTRRKAICVVQIVGLGIVVSPVLAVPASMAAAALMLAALTWSFGIDVLWLRRHRA